MIHLEDIHNLDYYMHLDEFIFISLYYLSCKSNVVLLKRYFNFFIQLANSKTCMSNKLFRARIKLM